jgi:hypothetical protein
MLLSGGLLASLGESSAATADGEVVSETVSGAQICFALWDTFNFPATDSITLTVGDPWSAPGFGSMTFTPAVLTLMVCAEQMVLAAHLPRAAAGEVRAPASLPKPLDLTWISLAQSGPESIDGSTLAKLVEGLTATLRVGRLDIVNNAYRDVQIEQMSLEAMMAFLRVPYVVRGRLDRWRGFLAKVRAEGARRHVNSPHFLKGLI